MKTTTKIIIAIIALAVVAALVGPMILVKTVDKDFNEIKLSGETVEVKFDNITRLIFDEDPDNRLLISYDEYSFDKRYEIVVDSTLTGEVVVEMDKTIADVMTLSAESDSSLVFCLDMHSLSPDMAMQSGGMKFFELISDSDVVLAKIRVAPGLISVIENPVKDDHRLPTIAIDGFKMNSTLEFRGEFAFLDVYNSNIGSIGAFTKDFTISLYDSTVGQISSEGSDLTISCDMGSEIGAINYLQTVGDCTIEIEDGYDHIGQLIYKVGEDMTEVDVNLQVPATMPVTINR